jgi:hypothetical protein
MMLRVAAVLVDDTGLADHQAGRVLVWVDAAIQAWFSSL